MGTRNVLEAARQAGVRRVVVTHDSVIRPLLAWIEPGVHAQVETASWSELHYDGGAWAIASLDNTPA